ncbi:hypothetical protein [Paenibacillus sp. 1P07SE]|uniref:hypothetical protein n=1 Tax=Paenibacillus sp. 1P07SE TaxID=3132209 RepID=UPI0039A6C544
MMEEQLDQERRRVLRQHASFLFNVMLLLAIGSSMALLLMRIFYWKLVDWMTPLFAPFVNLAVIAVFLGSSVAALVYLILPGSRKRRQKLAPLGVQAVAGVLALVVPFTAISLQLDHRSHRAEREAVVQMIAEGQLQPNVDYNPSLIRLPEGYRHLSSGGGEIVAHQIGDNLQVFFFTYRGMIDNMAGFVYSADGSPPDEERFGVTQLLELKPFGPRWYWLSAS